MILLLLPDSPCDVRYCGTTTLLIINSLRATLPSHMSLPEHLPCPIHVSVPGFGNQRLPALIRFIPVVVPAFFGIYRKDRFLLPPNSDLAKRVLVGFFWFSGFAM